MIKIYRITAPLLVLGLGAGVYALLHAAKPEPDKREEVPRPVSVFVEIVQSADVNLDVFTQGEVRSRAAIDMVAQVGGRITHVSEEFTEGGAFLPGVPLVTIEDTDYQLVLTQADARMAEARVAVELALADADVARQQLRGTPNPSDLALKKPQVAEARARQKAAEADLAQARLNLSRTEVSLPFTGRVAGTYVDVGQYVSPGTPLGRAFATDRVELRLPINDGQLASLGLPIGYSAGENGGLMVALSADVAGREHLWSGELLRLDAAIDSETRLLYAIAVVEDPYGENVSQHGMPLAVGLYVKAVIRGRRMADAVRIPRGALRAGDTVYLINDRGLLEVRKVAVVHSSPDFAVIREGLNSGDQVVVSSMRNPIQGMALEAANAPASAAAAAGNGEG